MEGRATDRRFPLQVALGYVLVAGVYILGSGWLASSLAGSAEQLESIERWKGLAFVVVTGLLVYLLCRRFVEQVAREADAHHRTREALAVADRRTIPALLAASLAHDANNALGVVLGHLDLVAETPGLDSGAHSSLSQAREAAQKVVALNRRLARSAREQVAGEPTCFDLVEVVHESLDLLRYHEKVRASHLDLVPGPPCPMSGYPELIHQIAVNLVINAAEASPGDGGTIRVRVESEPSAVRFEVEDDGPGFSPEIEESAFDAFRTTKKVGTGIGLFSVKHCAELHGGRAELGRSTLGGARVSVWLPLGRPASPLVSQAI